MSTFWLARCVQRMANASACSQTTPDARPYPALPYHFPTPCPWRSGTPVKRGSNLFDLLEHRNDTFLLAEAIAAAGLESELRKIKKSTLFAPTDAAFEALLEDLNIEPEALFNNTELLTSVLQFHIVDGAIKAADLEDGQEVETFLEGQVRE